MILESLFLILSAVFLGYEIFNRLLASYFDVYTIFGIGSSFGIILSSWIFFISSLFIPLTYAHGMTHALILFSTGIILQLSHKKAKIDFKINPIFIFSVIAPFIVLSLFIQFSLLYNENITRGACYGDTPFHLSLISSFTYGCNKKRNSLFDILTPFFANEQLAYTFIPDFYSAVFVSCFKSTFHISLVLPSFFYAYSILVVLYQIVHKFTKQDKAACLFAPWLFLLSGGLGFTEYNKYKDTYYIDFVHNWGNGRTEGWFQTVIHILLPQRCSLFSMPIAYSIILILMTAGKSEIVNPRPFIAVGLLVASLPQVQMHSVIAVAQWGVFYVIRSFPYREIKKCFKPYLINYSILAVIALALGLPQIYPFLGRMNNNNFMQIKPLWKDDLSRNYNFFTFWIYALGVFFVLSIFGRLLCITILSSEQKEFYDPSLLIFIVANFVWYQPWNLDNTKVFNAGWIPLAVAFVSFILIKIWKKIKYVGPIISLTLFVFANLSGFIAVSLAAKRNYPVWFNDSIEFSKYIISATDPKSVWVTDTSHTNPAVALAGRQTLVGYQGWISSHGLDDRKRTMIIRQLSRDPENTLAVDKLNVSYVLVVSNQRSDFNFNPSENSRKWKLIYKTRVNSIYKRTNV